MLLSHHIHISSLFCPFFTFPRQYFVVLQYVLRHIQISLRNRICCFSNTYFWKGIDRGVPDLS